MFSAQISLFWASLEQDNSHRYATLSPLPSTFEGAKHRGIPTPPGPPGTPDQGLRAEAVNPAGLGKEKVSQWHYFPHPVVPEDVAEQTQSGEILIFLQRFLPSRDFSFPHQLSPCHSQNFLLLLQTWDNLIAFLPPTLPQSVPTNFCSLLCGCLFPSQIPPAQGSQCHIFGPIKTLSIVLDATEKPQSELLGKVLYRM